MWRRLHGVLCAAARSVRLYAEIGDLRIDNELANDIVDRLVTPVDVVDGANEHATWLGEARHPH
jgi:hypothetical protein